MTEVLQRVLSVNEPSDTTDSASKFDECHGLNDDFSSDEDALQKRSKKRIQQFTDSDSAHENEVSTGPQQDTTGLQSSDTDDGLTIFKKKSSKSRIQRHDSSSDSSKPNRGSKLSFSSDSENENVIRKSSGVESRTQAVTNGNSSSDQAVKNEQQQARMKNKRHKIKDKFKSLKSSRDRSIPSNIDRELNKNSSSEESNDDGNSIEKIKQKIKEKMSSIPSICDPDTSDEENEQKSMPKHKKERKIKVMSPKPQRMSAKQAMENMQKIKSESNRMLREKEVSLPYHRPKALSLKDIMSRRRPAVSSDGKSLPIKMNGEQLKQYAQMLEERQKEMKELWQSDTDEENEDKLSENEKFTCPNIENISRNDVASAADEPKPEQENIEVPNLNKSNAEDNDKLFDDLSQSIIKTTKIDVEVNNENKEQNSDKEVELNGSVNEEQDSENNMTLVFDDSKNSVTEDNTGSGRNSNINVEEELLKTVDDKVVEKKLPQIADECNTAGDNIHNNAANTNNTEMDSQLISLHFDTEKGDTEILDSEQFVSKINEESEKIVKDSMDVDDFSDDDDVNMVDIDNIIENAEIIRDIEDKVQSQVMLSSPLVVKPKLTGAPGMVIDLDDSSTAPKKSGVELLKERFTFFAKLKTPEEIEREKKQRIKPGNQHLRLKQELEEQMAEQRTIEWEKRLEEDKQQQKELKELRGDESDDEDDIDKIEAKLEENEPTTEQQKSESEEEEEKELLEDDIEMKDKPRKKNALLENEAEESDCDEDVKGGDVEAEEDEEIDNNEGDDENEEDDESSDSESSESEEETQPSKKGRILKAFEDSDEEDKEDKITEKDDVKSVGSVDLLGTQPASQDDVLPLAQRQKSASEDLFPSQGSSLIPSQKEVRPTQSETQDMEADVDLGTQTFSILDSTNNATAEKLDDILNGCEKDTGSTQTFVENNLDEKSSSFSQSLPPLPFTQLSQSQVIGEDVLAMCTGKFYENEFVSQVKDNVPIPLGESQDYDSDESSPMTVDDDAHINKEVDEPIDNTLDFVQCNTESSTKKVETVLENSNTTKSELKNVKPNVVDDNLKSILDELDDPEFDRPKPNKFFCGAKTQKTEETKKAEEIQIKKKFVIESDDETNDGGVSAKKKKKHKKRKLENRALQISDDEDELSEHEEEDFESEVEEENEERVVEYDSEENEIEIKPQNQKPSKKKRKGNEFFEQEAELTSEDEWVGSGDEDEAGLDRMEREEGDDDSFHQGKLQRELGQIHMRDVLDQDKREVRIIQELLFEDGDLGGGGRQRKFKWKNIDGDDETGTGSAEFGDSQEEEFESEEQWRKQRHERETFLRQMQNNSELDDSLNVSINRTTIIKANLMSKTMSMLLEENQPPVEKADSPVAAEKKTTLPSPKKPFSLLQQSYQGSILNRGKGALARLAALATPLAVDDDAPKGKSAAPSSGRNFVFAALTPEAPKVAKRKADVNPGTPKLVKKMKTEEKQNMSKSRLLDQMNM